jgi:hypothetical protein
MHSHWPDVSAYYADNGFGELIRISDDSFFQRIYACVYIWTAEYH